MGGQVDQEKEEEVARLREENDTITAALQSAMDENSHMSEKLLLSEQANDLLKTKLEELKAQTEEVNNFLQRSQDLPAGTRSLFEKLLHKVKEVDEDHKKAEETLMRACQMDWPA